MKIENSVILVTGASSGIGKVVAEYLAKLNGIVYICDIQKDKGNKIQSESNGKIIFISCDVSDEAQVKEMMDQIYSEQGRIDIVVNNAGITSGIESNKVKDLTNQFDKIMKVNLIGAFLVSKFAAEKMIKNFDAKKPCNGVIIHISSIMGLQGMKQLLIYSTSKGGLIGMTLPMARDLGKFKIRVNSILPGLFETPMGEIAKNKYFSSVQRSTPIGRLGEPIEIAQAVEQIVLNDFMNGSLIKVDGGIVGNF